MKTYDDKGMEKVQKMWESMKDVCIDMQNVRR